MKRFTVISLLLLCNYAQAADSTTVKFMNSIYKQVINISYKYYYVLDEAKNPIIGIDDLEHIKHCVPKELKDIPFKDLLSGTSSDTSRFKWSNFPLPKARYVDRNNLPNHVGPTRLFKRIPKNSARSTIDSLENIGVIPVPSKSRRQGDRLIKRIVATLNKRPIEERNYYVFSKPMFTNNKQYALIKVDEVGQGCTYLFKNQNGKWHIIAAINWVA